MSATDSSKDEPEEKSSPKFTVTDRRHWTLEEDGAVEEAEERLPSYVEQLKQEAEEKDKRLREYIAAYKSKNAETDDLRHRLQKENEGRFDQMKAGFFNKLVPILDNLKRASDSARSASDFDSFKEGIDLIISQFLRELKGQGVEMISAAGRAFDPKTDEAFITAETDDPEKDNLVLEDLEPGTATRTNSSNPLK